MTLALLGRSRGRCWWSTTGSVASAPLRRAGCGGPGCGRPGCPRPGRVRPGRPGSSWPARWAGRCQQPLAALVQPAGRRRAGQRDNPAAIMLGEAPRSAGSWPVAEPVDALGVGPVQPLPHRLRVAASWSAIWVVRRPSQLWAIIRARRIQSPGACRAPASLRTVRSSAGSIGGRANSRTGTAAPLLGAQLATATGCVAAQHAHRPTGMNPVAGLGRTPLGADLFVCVTGG
jgi:hypothetical protein